VIGIAAMSLANARTFALTQLLAEEWAATHPHQCNCERCEWVWSMLFRDALRSTNAFKEEFAQRGYKVIDLESGRENEMEGAK
jgi:hypothetical protein